MRAWFTITLDECPNANSRHLAPDAARSGIVRQLVRAPVAQRSFVAREHRRPWSPLRCRCRALHQEQHLAPVPDKRIRYVRRTVEIADAADWNVRSGQARLPFCTRSGVRAVAGSRWTGLC